MTNITPFNPKSHISPQIPWSSDEENDDMSKGGDILLYEYNPKVFNED